MNTVKLFFKNKLFEIINWFYDMWGDDILCKYTVIYLLTVVPVVIVLYPYMNIIVTDAEMFPTLGRCVVLVSIHIFGLLFTCLGHMGLIKLFEWIKGNIKKAKNGTEVKLRWKD